MSDAPQVPENRASPFDRLNWVPLLESVGLDTEKGERLTRLLVVHLLLDRLLTIGLIKKKILQSSSSDAPDLKKITNDTSDLRFAARVGLAEGLGIVTPAIAAAMSEVNKVRNSLVHYKPKLGGKGWAVDEVPEIASQQECEACTQKGIEAVQELAKFIWQ